MVDLYSKLELVSKEMRERERERDVHIARFIQPRQ